MAGSLSGLLSYKMRLEKEIRSYRGMLDTADQMYKHINRLQQIGYVYESINQMQQLRKQLAEHESLIELSARVEAIQNSLEGDGIDETVRRAISVLHSQAHLIPEVLSSEIITSISNLRESVELAMDNPVQRIYQFKTAAEIFEDRLESMEPRYVLHWKGVLESDDYSDRIKPELVIRDSKTATGKRDAALSVLPGVLSVQDVSKDIASEEAMDFYFHLAIFPMLATVHPVGERILKAVPSLECQECEEIVLYRGRVKERGARPFVEDEMWSPPLDKACQGRANPQGLSYLYTCDTLDGVIAEIEKPSDEVVDVIQWHLTKPVPVFDLSMCSDTLFKYCQFGSNGGAFKPEYLIPNYIAQCLKYAGIPAMKIPSVKHPGSMTYVFFTYERQWFENISFHADVGE